MARWYRLGLMAFDFVGGVGLRHEQFRRARPTHGGG